MKKILVVSTLIFALLVLVSCPSEMSGQELLAQQYIKEVQKETVTSSFEGTYYVNAKTSSLHWYVSLSSGTMTAVAQETNVYGVVTGTYAYAEPELTITVDGKTIEGPIDGNVYRAFPIGDVSMEKISDGAYSPLTSLGNTHWGEIYTHGRNGFVFNSDGTAKKYSNVSVIDTTWSPSGNALTIGDKSYKAYIFGETLYIDWDEYRKIND